MQHRPYLPPPQQRPPRAPLFTWFRPHRQRYAPEHRHNIVRFASYRDHMYEIRRLGPLTYRAIAIAVATRIPAAHADCECIDLATDWCEAHAEALLPPQPATTFDHPTRPIRQALRRLRKVKL